MPTEFIFALNLSFNMNNKFIIGLLVVLVAAVSFLAIQNYKLSKKIEGLAAPSGEVKINPVAPADPRANPPGASPFDKPNVDPLADQFIETPPIEQLTTIKFDKIVHDFGRINQGAVVSTNFRFTNTGKFPLLITKAEGSCGCTVPVWPKAAIQPGESGQIAVQFDSHDKSGQTDKTVTVTANSHPVKTVLVIKSVVVPQDK